MRLPTPWRMPCSSCRRQDLRRGDLLQKAARLIHHVEAVVMLPNRHSDGARQEPRWLLTIADRMTHHIVKYEANLM